MSAGHQNILILLLHLKNGFDAPDMPWCACVVHAVKKKREILLPAKKVS